MPSNETLHAVHVAAGPHPGGMDVCGRSFLVGFDASPGAENALWYTIEKLVVPGDSIFVVTVLDKIVVENMRARASSANEGQLQAALKAEAEDLARRLRSLETLQKVNVDVRYVPDAHDRPHYVIHDEAAKILPSMVVLGAHGAGIEHERNRMKHAWEIEKIVRPSKENVLGYVASHLIGMYDWPVCVVPQVWERHTKGIASLLRTSLSPGDVRSAS